MEHTDSTFGTTLAFGKIMSYLCSVKDVKMLRRFACEDVKVFIDSTHDSTLHKTLHKTLNTLTP